MITFLTKFKTVGELSKHDAMKPTPTLTVLFFLQET